MNRFLSRLVLPLTIVVVLAACSLHAQSTTSKVDGRYLDELARATLRRGRIPGAALAVVKDGAVAHVNAYGTANLETLEPMAPETLCRIGSTSKVFTALLFAILVDEGEIRLGDRIGESVKGLPPKLAALTGMQLLIHTGGLQDRGEILDYWGRSDEGSLAAKTASFTDDLVFTEPGTLFSYSNLHYVLAGRWCEVVGRKPFGRMVKERIFDPVGMTSSTLDLSDAMTHPVSQGHVPEDHPFARVDVHRAKQPTDYKPSGTRKLALVRPWPNNASRGPSGYVISNVKDLARFAIALMNGGEREKTLILPGPDGGKKPAEYLQVRYRAYRRR